MICPPHFERVHLLTRSAGDPATHLMLSWLRAGVFAAASVSACCQLSAKVGVFCGEFSHPSIKQSVDCCVVVALISVNPRSRRANLAAFFSSIAVISVIRCRRRECSWVLQSLARREKGMWCGRRTGEGATERGRAGLCNRNAVLWTTTHRDRENSERGHGMVRGVSLGALCSGEPSNKRFELQTSIVGE